MIAQRWPLVARTTDGAHYFVIGWEETDKQGEPLVPVVVPRTPYGKAGRPTTVVLATGGRQVVYESSPAGPTVLPLHDVDGWLGPALVEP